MTAGDPANCWIAGGHFLRLRATALALRGPPLQLHRCYVSLGLYISPNTELFCPSVSQISGNEIFERHADGFEYCDAIVGIRDRFGFRNQFVDRSIDAAALDDAFVQRYNDVACFVERSFV